MASKEAQKAYEEIFIRYVWKKNVSFKDLREEVCQEFPDIADEIRDIWKQEEASGKLKTRKADAWFEQHAALYNAKFGISKGIHLN